MRFAERDEEVCFSTKGQIVLPAWIRREFHIEKGTRAIDYPEGDHIVLKPVTASTYTAMRGSLKGKGLLEALEEDRKRERKR